MGGLLPQRRHHRLACVLVACLTAACVLTAACGPGGTGRMVAGNPPSGWEQDLLEWRADKDGRFKEDPETPLLAEDVPSFAGLDYWPPDPALRFVGPIHPHPQPERFRIITTAGQVRPCERHGWLSFVLGGQTHVLQIYKLLDSTVADQTRSLFLPFTDMTSGKETYPAGRYVNLERNDDGEYVLDFNRAFNPSCAYGDPQRFACPVAPEANRLPLRVEAGERGFKREDPS